MPVEVEENARLADLSVVSTAEPPKTCGISFSPRPCAQTATAQIKDLRHSADAFVLVWPQESDLAHSFDRLTQTATTQIGDLRHSADAFVFAWPLALEVAEITSFGTEPYSVTGPIPVVIEELGDSFVAGVESASVYASGSTSQEAIGDLKTMLLDVFETLCTHQEVLGAVAARQLEALSRLIVPDAEIH